MQWFLQVFTHSIWWVFFLKIVLKLVFKASWNCSHEDRPCPCGNNPRYLKNNSRWIYLKTVACLEACLKVQYLTRIQFSHCKISTLKAVWALTTPHPCRNCQQQPHCSQGWEAWLVTYPTTMGFPAKNDHFGVFWTIQETPLWQSLCIIFAIRSWLFNSSYRIGGACWAPWFTTSSIMERLVKMRVVLVDLYDFTIVLDGFEPPSSPRKGTRKVEPDHHQQTHHCYRF